MAQDGAGVEQLPECDVYGCEKPAPVEYTDTGDRRCLDCLDADRDLGEVPTAWPTNNLPARC